MFLFVFCFLFVAHVALFRLCVGFSDVIDAGIGVS